MKTLLSFLFLIVSYNISIAQFIDHKHIWDDEILPWIDEIQLSDMDADGDLDYIILSHQSKIITIAYHDGFNIPLFDTIMSPLTLRNIVVFDFDADGDLDIMASAPFDDISLWWRNEGAGQFVKMDFPINDYSSLIFEDINGDNTIDMVASVNDSLNIYNLDSGIISLRKTIDYDNFSLTLRSLRTFDKQGDGNLEIIGANSSDGIILYEQGASDEFTRVDLLPTVYTVEHVEVTDFNADGFFDLVATSTFNGSCKVFINQGDDSFTEESITPQVNRIRFSNVIDYDNDGDNDILYYDVGFGESGILFVYKNENGAFTSQELSKEYERVEIAAVGDIDNDGDTDIVLGDNPYFNTSIILLENGGGVYSNDLSSSEYKIYPTLVTANFVLETNDPIEYTVFDINGSVIRKGYSSNGQTLISTQGITSGVFYVQLEKKDQKVMIKLIKVNK